MKVCFYVFSILVLHCSFTASHNLQPLASQASALALVNSQADGHWIFVGQFSPSKNIWLSKYFDNELFPEAGQTLTAIKPANKRTSLPVKENGYKLTTYSGKVKTGESVKVEEVKALVGNFYWIRVK